MYYTHPRMVQAWIRIKSLGLFEEEQILFKKYLPLPPARILVVGCGTGRETLPLARQNYQMVASDFSIPMVRQLHKHAFLEKLNIQCLVMDAVSISFEHQQFDAICIMSILWSLMGVAGCERREALREACRVLKAGGVLFLSTPSRIIQPDRGPYAIMRPKSIWMAFKGWLKILGGLSIDVFHRDSAFLPGDRPAPWGGVRHLHSLRELDAEVKVAGFHILERMVRGGFIYMVAVKPTSALGL